MESAAEGESLRAALICVKRADRQRTDCRVNTRLLSGPRCTLRLHDSLHVLLTQCALWRRDSFLSLAVHSLRSGGEICTTDSDEFQRSCVLLRLLTRYIERLLTKCHQIFKFDDLRKCLFLLLPFFFFSPVLVTLCWTQQQLYTHCDVGILHERDSLLQSSCVKTLLYCLYFFFTFWRCTFFFLFTFLGWNEKYSALFHPLCSHC